MLVRVRSLLDSLSPPSAYVLDKDGTLVTQGVPIDGAADFLRLLTLQRTPYVVLSNTGERSSAEVAGELSQLLQVPIPPVCVHTAAQQMASRLAEAAEFDRIVLVGEAPAAARGALRDVHSVVHCVARAHEHRDASRTCVAVFSDGHVRDFCDAVAAASALVDRGASLWMTSADRSVTAPDGSHRPGPGVFLQAVEFTRGRKTPRLRIFGKGGNESHAMVAHAMRLLATQGFASSPRSVMMVGDRYDTDIRTGNDAGWRTCLVESGCHREDTHAAEFSEDVADEVADSVRDLMHRKPTTTLSEVIAELVRQSLRTTTWAGARARAKRVSAPAAASAVAAPSSPPPRRTSSLPNLAGYAP